MKAKKRTPKQIVWPPRMTPKRKRALVLLQEWANKRIEIEYCASTGVTFTGTLSELSLDERRTSFFFNNDFGIHAILSTDLYDRIEVTEIGDLPINVAFFRKSDFRDGFSIRPKDERAKPKRDLARVYELFRHWERLNTMLMVNTGDGMRITVACGKVKELSDRFMFTISDTEMIHLLVPAQSTHVRFEVEGDKVSVMLYNDKSGMQVTVTNRVEGPEDLINRFSALTTVVQ